MNPSTIYGQRVGDVRSLQAILRNAGNLSARALESRRRAQARDSALPSRGQRAPKTLPASCVPSDPRESSFGVNLCQRTFERLDVYLLGRTGYLSDS